tara:strand:- start:53 stop:463 length:411 start_codon:yes stop_codon:yes gene_type:complete
MTETDAAYLAGLFDGEGSVYYKRTKQIRHNRPGKPVHNIWVIRMEIAMTEKSIINWVHDFTGVGHSGPRKVKPGKKKQWRWRCSHRDAYYVSRLIWPYAHVKLNKIQQIIDHYAEHKVMNGNIVSLTEYKKAMSLE